MKVTSTGRYNKPNYINQKTNVKNNHNSNTFKGAGIDAAFNILDKGFQLLDKNAMIQVAFVDSVATDIPRTLVDFATSLAAAFETARREFSGLIVNCLIPGVIVKGVAKLLPKDVYLKGTDAANSWANGDVIDKLSGVYKSVQTSPNVDCTRDYVQKSLASLSGLDGKEWVKYSDSIDKPEFQEAVDKITEAIRRKPKERKPLLADAKTKLAGLTKAESVLKFGDAPQANLEETIRDIADMGSKFNVVKKDAMERIGNADDSVVNNVISGAIDKYSTSLKKLVNKKSIIGMALVIAMAVSVQKINRAITRKQFKAEGAPIYKDFGKKDTRQKMTEEEKKTFKYKKIGAAAGMVT
ncbi:hypothetical protein IJ425_06675, partial [bacterium]|nr:hypothetical protein [bacterium]